ncbi:MAG: hypothetical protein WCZ23_16490 [Rhodospirillaceae bacterium]
MADSQALEGLRARIRALERPGQDRAPVVSMGAATLDAALPWGGLPRGRVHQVTGGEDGFLGPVLGFAAGLAGRLVSEDAPLLWVVQAGSADDALYAPGLAALGLPPGRLLVARATDPAEVLWCMEEALRCPALGAVIGQVRSVDMTAGRRLQLAAEQGGVTGFVLPSAHGAGWREAAATPATAATTRWRVEPAPSAAVPWRGLGPPRWSLTLERCQGGLPRSWLVEKADATGDLVVVATLSDRPADPGPLRRLA